MSRPASAMNPGQMNKKFIYMALGLGLVGAILLYAAFARTSGSDKVAGGDKVPVVVAKQDIAARTKITANMLEVKLVPQDVASPLAYTDTSQVVNKITRYPIAAAEQVLPDKVVDVQGGATAAQKALAFVIPPGKRAIAVNVKDVTTAGGLVLPGDRVDVLVVYDIEFANPADPTSRQKVDSYLVDTLFQDVEVLAVSQTFVDRVLGTSSDGSQGANDAGVRNSEAKPDPNASTVTLALTPEEASKLYLASENGRIRFSVRPYGDDQIKPIDPITENDLWPRNLPNPFIR
jgi:pilus assembly protein CpaB